jgi:hypothetical protein
MTRKPDLAKEFHDAEAALLEAQANFAKAKSDYFLSRRERIRAGQAVEPLSCLDANLWQEQLGREQILRANHAEDVRAGLVA